MAEILKFHEKNKILFIKQEVTSGTYIASATTDATPCLTLDGSITTDTGTYTYLGDSLSRDEYTYVKDQYADFTFETPQQILGTLNGSLTVAAAPLAVELQACGGAVTVLGSSQGSFAAGTVWIDNTQVSNTTVSVEDREASAQDTTNQKLRKYTGCRGMVDVTASLGDVPKLKFTYKGNSTPPIQSVILTPDMGLQFVNVASSVLLATVVNAQIASRTDAFVTLNSIATGVTVTTITKAGNVATATTSGAHLLGNNGDIRFVAISGATDPLYNGTFMITITSATTFIYIMGGIPASNASGTFVTTVGTAPKSFCFNTFTAPNYFGFEYARYVTGCETGFSKTAVPTDVTVSILESASPTTAITNISSTTTTATITAAGHGLVVGNSVTISNTDAHYNGTYVVQAGGFTADAFTVTITSYTGSYATAGGLVTNNSYINFDPDSNISNFFGAQVKFGSAAGKYVTYKQDKLQIKDVKEGKIGSFLARDISFRNTGKSWIILE